MTVEELHAREPLWRFSLYTGYQVRIIKELGAEIRTLLDEAIEGSNVDGVRFSQIYAKFWLWVLGAYEVVRTMSQSKSSFSPSTFLRISDYKRQIAVIRIPFAKQELAGNGTRIRGEALVSSIDSATKDFGFSVKNVKVSIRGMTRDFDDLIAGITPEDVL